MLDDEYYLGFKRHLYITGQEAFAHLFEIMIYSPSIHKRFRKAIMPKNV